MILAGIFAPLSGFFFLLELCFLFLWRGGGADRLYVVGRDNCVFFIREL